jgi:putative transposase
VGSSRYHLLQAVERSLIRLGTDYIDLFQLHGFDARTPTEEVLSTLDALVRAGKIPERPNQVWSIDFVSDSLETGRRVKCLTIVDDFTKEAVDIVVDHGISGQYVTRVLDAAARFRELPRTIRTDQGPEFTGKAMDAWAYQRGIELRLIEAGKPTQNAYVESFNGKFRDECLNEHWFRTLAEARAAVAAWRADYNQGRPHSALEYLTPAEFAAAWRSRHAGSAKQIAES